MKLDGEEYLVLQDKSDSGQDAPPAVLMQPHQHSQHGIEAEAGEGLHKQQAVAEKGCNSD